MRARYELYPNQMTLGVRVATNRAAEVSFDPLGDHVRQDDETLSPCRFSYREDLPSGTRCLVEFAHDERARPVVDSIHIQRQPSGRGLRSADFGTLRNLQDLMEEVWVAVSRRETSVGEDLTIMPSFPTPAAVERDMKRTVRGLGRQTRRRATPERVAEVARIYLENQVGGAPVKAVMATLGMAESTAFRYVAMARQADLIPPRETGAPK